MFILDSILVIIFTVHIYFVGIFNLFFLFPGRINQKEKKSSEIQLPSPGKVIKTWKHFESEGAATLCRTTVREEINDVLCEQERKKTLTQCHPATHDAAQQLALLMTKMSGLTCLEMTCSKTRAVPLMVLGIWINLDPLPSAQLKDQNCWCVHPLCQMTEIRAGYKPGKWQLSLADLELVWELVFTRVKTREMVWSRQRESAKLLNWLCFPRFLETSHTRGRNIQMEFPKDVPIHVSTQLLYSILRQHRGREARKRQNKEVYCELVSSTCD